MTFELICKGWVGTNKINEGRMSITLRRREFTKTVVKRDIKKIKKGKVDTRGQRGKNERVEGTVLTFWRNSKCIMFSAVCGFSLRTNVYRYIHLSTSFYVYLALFSLLEWAEITEYFSKGALQICHIKKL